MITNAQAVAYLRDSAATEQTVSVYVGLANELVDSALSPDLDPGSVEVRLITLNVVARAWRNPRGAESDTERIDDYSRTLRYANADQAGVYLTDRERRVLSGASEADAEPDGWAGSIAYQR